MAVCVASACAASYGGYSTPEIKVTSYEAPAVKTASYSSYAAPEVKTASYGYAAVPELKKAPIPIVRFNLNDDNYGTFNFDHLSGDGTSVTEEGHLKSLPGDLEGPVSVMSGAYSFLGDDGVTYKVTWTADGKKLRPFFDSVSCLIVGYLNIFQRMDSVPSVTTSPPHHQSQSSLSEPTPRLRLTHPTRPL